jgi:hypothetical protein
MCLVTDTFWLFTSQNWGTVKCNTKETWDELFKKRYPSIYQRISCKIFLIVGLLKKYLLKINFNYFYSSIANSISILTTACSISLKSIGSDPGA